jgi:hypothetical protein
VSTWRPIIDVLKSRLYSWRNRYVSLGGRVVLINSVLAAIPIFYLSFLKMPTSVWRTLIAIQRHFLWGGASAKRKICWVKWEDVCRLKNQGGLGVERHLRIMNISLMTKWRWQLLSENEPCWKGIIQAKYGRGRDLGEWVFRETPKSSDSLWWKDLLKVGIVAGFD